LPHSTLKCGIDTQERLPNMPCCSGWQAETAGAKEVLADGTVINVNSENFLPTSMLLTMQYNRPRIAEILGANVDDIEYTIRDCVRESVAISESRDPIISTHGLTEELGFARISNRRGLHAPLNWAGIGIQVYETRGLEQPIKYAMLCFHTPSGGYEGILATRKGDYFRLVRHWKRVIAKNTEMEPPVLPDGVLEDILKNSVEFLTKKKKIASFGVNVRRGIVLSGPPGNGKSMVCRYLKSICNKNHIYHRTIRAGEIQNAYAENVLESLFSDNGIIFLDDIDISFFSRRTGGSNDKMACALLAAMDGVETTGNSIRIFTTNEHLSDMDEAFRRPGRIDKVYHFKKPTNEGIRRLLESWPKEMLEGIDIEEAVKMCEGHSFAEVDAIRANMVTNHIIDEKPWDFRTAHEEMSQNQEEKDNGADFSRSKVGFAPN